MISFPSELVSQSIRNGIIWRLLVYVRDEEVEQHCSGVWSRYPVSLVSVV
jgi:hypothetical protein